MDAGVGEPDALKGACPVRKGTIGNVITTRQVWITRAGSLLYAVGLGFESLVAHSLYRAKGSVPSLSKCIYFS